MYDATTATSSLLPRSIEREPIHARHVRRVESPHTTVFSRRLCARAGQARRTFLPIYGRGDAFCGTRAKACAPCRSLCTHSAGSVLAACARAQCVTRDRSGCHHLRQPCPVRPCRRAQAGQDRCLLPRRRHLARSSSLVQCWECDVRHKEPLAEEGKESVVPLDVENTSARMAQNGCCKASAG